MRTINIKPVEIIGDCPPGLTPADEFQVEGMRLENPKQSNVCFLALSHFPIMVWHLESESRFFSHASCPGCISRLDRENRVVFLLGHADKWGLCQLISEYLRLCRQHEETDAAGRLRAEAIHLQNQGEFANANRKMEAAVKEMRDATALRNAS
ncbi:MAG: hypothetical protein R6X31_15350 [Anaerolineae bacterium]